MRFSVCRDAHLVRIERQRLACLMKHPPHSRPDVDFISGSRHMYGHFVRRQRNKGWKPQPVLQVKRQGNRGHLANK